MIDFESVEKNDEHARVLYDLLLARDVKQNISHQSKPDYEEHENFVFNHPYRAWYLVKNGNEYIGSVNILESNTMGLYISVDNVAAIKKAVQFLKDQYKPLPPIKSVRQKGFVINVAIGNTAMEKIILNLDGQAVQTTYLL
jgi:hypothetical protein